jgi:hypothetical protein
VVVSMGLTSPAKVRNGWGLFKTGNHLNSNNK